MRHCFRGFRSEIKEKKKKLLLDFFFRKLFSQHPIFIKLSQEALAANCQNFQMFFFLRQFIALAKEALS